MEYNNNQTITAIMNRRSVRNFQKDYIIPNETLLTIVKAGMAAPSAVNKQPWAFIIITEREKLDKLAEGLPYAKMCKNVNSAIIVCGIKEHFLIGTDSDYWVQDCSAATENILLAVHSLGLGAVWTALYPYNDRMQIAYNVVEIPDNVIPLNLIPIGMPIGMEKPKDKWNPDRIHWEKW